MAKPIIQYHALILTSEYVRVRSLLVPNVPAEEITPDYLHAYAKEKVMRAGDRLLGVEISTTYLTLTH